MLCMVGSKVIKVKRKKFSCSLVLERERERESSLAAKDFLIQLIIIQHFNTPFIYNVHKEFSQKHEAFTENKHNNNRHNYQNAL